VGANSSQKDQKAREISRAFSFAATNCPLSKKYRPHPRKTPDFCG